MSCPIITIINETGTVKVMLVDNKGVGSAIPTGQNFIDLDIRQDYVTGDTAKVPVMLPHEFILSMDYCTQAVREQLLSWKYARERVTLCDPTVAPEGSVFGWRPLPIVNTTIGTETAYDLTGGYAVQSLGDCNKFAYWNPDTHEMEGPHATREAPLLISKHGRAYQPGRTTTNRASNPYPESATEGHGSGKAGWYLGDTSSIATLSWIDDGFDNSLCPDTLRVQTDGDAGSIDLTASAYFTPSHGDYGGWIPPSNSTCWASLWVKGAFPSTAEIEHGPDGNKAQYDISGNNYGQWTRIDVGEQNATWSEYNLAIKCTCAAGEVADFQVGPMMVCIEDSSQAHGGPGNFTAETNHTAANGYEVIRMTGLSFPSPQAATVTAWFALPTGSDVLSTTEYREIRSGVFRLPKTGGGSWDGHCFLQQKSAADPSVYQIRFVSLNSSTYWEIDGSTAFTPGLHSITITYGSYGLQCYYDGAQLTAESGGVSGFNAGTGTMVFANAEPTTDYMGGAVMYHGFSIQENENDAAGVAAIAAGLSNTLVRNLCDTTRGRLYEIVSVPSIPLIMEGDTAFMGDIRFRQLEYDPNDPAWFAEED